MVQPLWRTVCKLLKKLKIELPYYPAIPLLGIYPDRTIIQKGTCTPVFTAAVFIIANTWKQPKCPSTDEWIKKMWYRDFPGGPVVKNPPCNAGDVGSIPGRRTKIPHAAGQLSLRATTTEPTCSGTCTPQLQSPRALEPARHN